MVLIAPQYQMPKRLLKIQNGIFHLLPKAAFDGMGLEKKQMICLTNSMQNLQLEEQCRRVSCPVLVPVSYTHLAANYGKCTSGNVKKHQQIVEQASTEYKQVKQFMKAYLDRKIGFFQAINHAADGITRCV